LKSTYQLKKNELQECIYKRSHFLRIIANSIANNQSKTEFGAQQYLSRQVRADENQRPGRCGHRKIFGL